MELEAYMVLPLGLAAGFVTTVAGLGGGLLLTVVLAALISPIEALAIAAPALLLGNLHRMWLFRSHLDATFLRAFLVGAGPGALVGALAAVALPEWFVRAAIAVSLALAVAKQVGWIRFSPSARSRGVVSFMAGAITATSGGGGLILGPLLLASGAKGPRFVASASAIASVMHLCRAAGYGAGGVVSGRLLLLSAVLGGAILVGNTLGKRLRLSERTSLRLTYSVLVVCVAATVVGGA
ncbi:MAG: TSUP family transporter [Myxococcota bacterium]